MLLESDDPKFFVIVGVLLSEGLGGLRSVQVSPSNELDGWSNDELPPALIEETGCLRNVASGERMQLSHTQQTIMQTRCRALCLVNKYIAGPKWVNVAHNEYYNNHLYRTVCSGLAWMQRCVQIGLDQSVNGIAVVSVSTTRHKSFLVIIRWCTNQCVIWLVHETV